MNVGGWFLWSLFIFKVTFPLSAAVAVGRQAGRLVVGEVRRLSEKQVIQNQCVKK